MDCTQNPVIAYRRVSTARQADSGLGLDAQRTSIERWANPEERPIVEVEHAGVSGTVPFEARPGGSDLLDRLDAGDAAGIIVSSWDRLGRDALDLLTLSARALRQGWSIEAVDRPGVDLGTAWGRYLFGQEALTAQYQRDTISENTRRALREAKRRGVVLGQPATESTVAAGRRAIELRTSGLTWQGTIDQLHSEGHRPQRGGSWSITSVRRAASYAARDAGG